MMGGGRMAPKYYVEPISSGDGMGPGTINTVVSVNQRVIIEILGIVLSRNYDKPESLARTRDQCTHEPRALLSRTIGDYSP